MISHLAGLTKTQNTSGARSVSADASREAQLARGQERLSDLSSGQTLQGKVLSVGTNADGVRTVQVDIGDGAVVNAKLSGNMSLTEGQEISFSVKSAAEGGNVTLRPLYANMAADSNTLKALSQAGLPVTNDTSTMVREMMSAGMSIDRASLMQVGREVMAYPGHATGIVQMTDLGIPVTPENIEQFENYKNFEHQVMHSIDAIMEDLPEAFANLSSAGDAQGAMDLYGELLDLFSAPQAAAGQDALTSASEAGMPLQDPAAVIQEGDEGTVRVIADPSLEESAALNELKGAERGDAATTVGAGLSQTDSARDAVGAENARSGAAAEQGRVLEAAMKALAQASGSDAAPGATVVSSARAQGFQELLKALDIPEDVIRNALQGGEENSAQTELLRSLSDAYKRTAHHDARTDELWKKLFSSKEMGGLLKDAIARDWLIKPGDVEKKENVQSLYDRLQNQTSRLADILTKGHGAETKLAENVKNLQNNLHFMNDLNHMFQYVQLPLKMNGNNTHGDLYVYANKKNAMHEDGTVSALLHLDMEHMGPVDVFVKMRDNNVKTNFYLADDEMIDFLMEHIDVLNKRLEKRGYNMEAKLQLSDELGSEDAPVKEMIDGNLGRMTTLSHTAFEALA